MSAEIKVKKAIVAFFSVVLALVAFGDGPYFFTATDESHAISEAAYWADKDGQTRQDISPDADYVIPVGKTARITAKTFAGKSLTVGDETGAATLLNKYYSTTEFATFNNLILRQGTLLAVNQSATDKRARVDGQITVAASASTPFVLKPKDNNTGLGFWLKADIVGAEGTGLELAGCERYNDTLTLSGDNSGFLGQLHVKTHSASSGYDDWNLTVDSPTALGGPLTAPTANAVLLTFEATAQMTFTANAGPTISAANRGITLDGNSGGLKLAVEEGAKVELALPIAGDGSVRKTGSGCLVLSGDFGASGTISCEEGTLMLASQSTLAKVGTIGGAISVLVPADGDFAVSGVSFDVASVVFRKAGAQIGTLVLDNTCTVSGKTTLTFEDGADLSDLSTEGVLLVKLPTSVKTVTADDFVVASPSASFGLPRVQVEVRDLGEGVQGVYAKRLFPVVTRAEGDPSASEGSTTFDAAQDSSGNPIWDNESAVQSGSDYLLTANHAIRSTAQFKGESLTLATSSSLLLKSLVQNISQIYAYPGSSILNSNPQTGETATLTGHLAVYGTWGNPAQVGDHGSTAGTIISSTLEGDGVLSLGRNQGDSLHFTLQGESGGFKGSILANADKPLELTVAGASALGGALESFNYRSLTLCDKVTLVPSETMSLAAENRGICIRDNVSVRVGEGVTLTVDEPLTYNGVLTKTGVGTLALGGRTWFENGTKDGVTETPTAGKNKLCLSGGAVKIASADALSGLVVVAGAGALQFNPAADCGALGAQPADVDLAAGALNVLMEAPHGDKYDVALLTVDSATAAKLLAAGALVVRDAERPSRKLVVRAVPAAGESGRTTFRVSYVKPGIILAVR